MIAGLEEPRRERKENPASLGYVIRDSAKLSFPKTFGLLLFLSQDLFDEGGSTRIIRSLFSLLVNPLQHVLAQRHRDFLFIQVSFA